MPVCGVKRHATMAVLGHHVARGALVWVWRPVGRGGCFYAVPRDFSSQRGKLYISRKIVVLKCWKLYKIITLTSTSSARNWLNIMRIKLSPIRMWRIQLWEPNLCKPTQVKTSNRHPRGCETHWTDVVWRQASQGAFRTSGR